MSFSLLLLTLLFELLSFSSPLICGSFLYENVNVSVSEALSLSASQTTNPQSASHMLNSESRRGNWFSYWLCLILCHQHPKQLCLCPVYLKSLNETLLMAAVLTPWLNKGFAAKNCWGGRTGGKRYYFVFLSELNSIYHLHLSTKTIPH